MLNFYITMEYERLRFEIPYLSWKIMDLDLRITEN